MAFYRKKPVVVEAIQWHKHEDHPQVEDVWVQVIRGMPIVVDEWEPGAEEYGRVQTWEGDMIVSPGDWVITGVAGEVYPCKPDIFERTYEPA